MNDPGPGTDDPHPPPLVPLPPTLAAPGQNGAGPLPPPAPAPAPHRLRCGIAGILLASYVVIPAIVGAQRTGHEGPMLPTVIRDLLLATGTELGMFGLVFAAVVWLGKLRPSDLWLGWRGGFWLIPRAAAWSIALRIGTGIALGGTLIAWQLISGTSPDSLLGSRPKVESMVAVEALSNPVYLILMLTLVSFVLAGLREELWRAGMIALLGRSLPALFGGRYGPWIAIVPIALLFGLAHTPQGWMGVMTTAVLGLGLGAVMILHRSLWDAVFAHGFFNATTFALLPWIAQKLPDLLRSAGG
jgi:membrane protease YdiL (CAAX protease family)